MCHDFNPPPGMAVDLGAGLRRIVAPNPSPMTFRGTNTYLLGITDIAVIDPGPNHKAHLDAILQAITPSQRISHIFVTHSHLDHSPLAAPLAKATGAPVLAFGGPTAGRSGAMQRLADEGFVGGGEGVDMAFCPDIELHDGQIVRASDWSIEVIHTPGHLGNHICLAWGEDCFTADHVMGWASSLVSPPDGDLTDFMTSCARLNERNWRYFYPGHGDIIATPRSRLEWLIQHRQNRESAILKVLDSGPASVADITAIVYAETPASLRPAASRNVLAHLVDLLGKSLVRTHGTPGADALFELTYE